MSAQPDAYPNAASGSPADDAGERSLENLRTYGPTHFRKRGAHALAAKLEWLLERRLPELEQQLAHSEQRRRKDEADAEREFFTLRRETVAWREYADELGWCRDHLRERLQDLHDALVAWDAIPWWRWRARRRAWEKLGWHAARAWAALEHPDPEPVRPAPPSEPAA